METARRLSTSATDLAKDIFGDIVESVWKVVEVYGDDEQDASRRLDNCILTCSDLGWLQPPNGAAVWVVFTNGNTVEFGASEWSHICPADILNSEIH